MNNKSEFVKGTTVESILFPLKFEASNLFNPKLYCSVKNCFCLILFLLNTDELKLSRLFTTVFVFSLICFMLNISLEFSISTSLNGVK